MNTKKNKNSLFCTIESTKNKMNLYCFVAMNTPCSLMFLVLKFFKLRMTCEP